MLCDEDEDRMGSKQWLYADGNRNVLKLPKQFEDVKETEKI
jgi:hypothetical protein